MFRLPGNREDAIRVPAQLLHRCSPEVLGAEVPPFSLQTLVENSVKYGGGEIRVSARNGSGRLVLNVWDSGAGFAKGSSMPLNSPAQAFPRRIASRVGERVVFVDVASITHFYAKDKLTFASTSSKDYVIDNTISELEQKLDPSQFIRIHRATLLNVNYIEETTSWFGNGMVVRLKDGKHTELQVARDRVRQLRSLLDF